MKIDILAQKLFTVLYDMQVGEIRTNMTTEELKSAGVTKEDYQTLLNMYSGVESLPGLVETTTLVRDVDIEFLGKVAREEIVQKLISVEKNKGTTSKTTEVTNQPLKEDDKK